MIIKTLNQESIQQINLFENITKARVKELFINNEQYIFIIEKGDMSKAIGKQGSNIRRISALLRKKIKVVEYDENALKFFNNLLYPLKIEDIKKTEKAIEVTSDTKTKALLIGRDRRNLKFYSKVLKEYFNTELIVK